MNILKSIVGFLVINESDLTASTDPTVYRIETNTHTYVGRIIYQNDVVIKFKSQESRAVKILKENIRKITIVSAERPSTNDLQLRRAYVQI